MSGYQPSSLTPSAYAVNMKGLHRAAGVLLPCSLHSVVHFASQYTLGLSTKSLHVLYPQEHLKSNREGWVPTPLYRASGVEKPPQALPLMACDILVCEAT